MCYNSDNDEKEEFSENEFIYDRLLTIKDLLLVATLGSVVHSAFIIQELIYYFDNKSESDVYKKEKNENDKYDLDVDHFKNLKLLIEYHDCVIKNLRKELENEYRKNN